MLVPVMGVRPVGVNMFNFMMGMFMGMRFFDYFRMLVEMMSVLQIIL